MATALDAALRPAARDLLATFGTALTITQTGAAFDTSDASVSHSATSQTVNGSPPSRMRTSADQPNIERGDMQTVVSPLDTGWSFAPAPGDVLDSNSKSYRVIDVWRLNSGDQVAAYKLQLRA